MIANFDEIKKQLKELAEVINAFKSDAVQLRLIELLFQRTPTTHQEPATVAKVRRPGRAKRAKASSSKSETQSKPAAARAGRGPSTLLDQLISEGFFATKRDIGAIIEHLREKKAHSFKPNELSGVLARFTRSDRLKRESNKDGQYEYYKEKK